MLYINFKKISRTVRRFAVRSSVALVALAAQGWAIEAIIWPADALAKTGQPLAYVVNASVNGVLTIDTGENTVVDSISGFNTPQSIAVAPNGSHVYVADSNGVSVIDAATNQVIDEIPIANFAYAPPQAIAATPDGKFIYVVFGNGLQSNGGVEVIDAAADVVLAVISIGGAPLAIAFSPDSKRAYVANANQYPLPPGSGQLYVIDTATNLVTATISIGYATGIAVDPTGKYVYITVSSGGNAGVYVIDAGTNTSIAGFLVGGLSQLTATKGLLLTPNGKSLYVGLFNINSEATSVAVYNTGANRLVPPLAATIPVSGDAQTFSSPSGIAVTPDGTRVYVANGAGGNSGQAVVSVIDTASNAVTATIPLAGALGAVGIVPPPQGVPFFAFNVDALNVQLRGVGTADSFELASSFTLSSKNCNGFHPKTETVKFQVGPFVGAIPAGSFAERGDGSYIYNGAIIAPISGINARAKIEPTGAFRYAFHLESNGLDLAGANNPVQVSLGVGGSAGLTPVQAHIGQDHQAVNH